MGKFRNKFMADLFFTDEAATYLRLSERKLYELWRRARCPEPKVPGRWLPSARGSRPWVTASLTASTPLAHGSWN